MVLDEADQMLERGFADTVEEILAAAFNPGESDCTCTGVCVFVFVCVCVCVGGGGGGGGVTIY